MKLIFNFSYMEMNTMGYHTRQRERILAVLQNSAGEHITADTLAARLEAEGNAVGKSTVYRYLDNLVGQGVVRKYIVEEGKRACYQYVGESAHCSNHYHLKCSRCGALLHVECTFLDEVGSHILAHHGFQLDGEKTVLYGICLNCTMETEVKK